MNKLIIVHYVNVDGVSENKIPERLKKLDELIPKQDDMISYIVPVFEEPTRVECINPQLLDETQYEKVRLQLNKISKIYEESC